MIKEKKESCGEISEMNITIKKHHRYKEMPDTEKTVSELAGIWEKSSIRFIVAAAAAFILTDAEFAGIRSPMAVSLCAASGIIGNMAGIPGIILSCILFGSLMNNIAELSAAVLMLIAKAVSMHRFSVKGTAGLAALSYFVCGLACTFYSGLSAAAVLAVLFRTGICAFAAYFFSRSQTIPFSDSKAADPVPLFISGIIIISALCGRPVWIFDMGRIFICIAGMIFSKKYGCTGGAAAGTAGAAALILSDSSFSRSAVFVACAGLAAGLGANRGKITVALTYLFTSLVMAVIIGLPAGVEGYIADSAAAALIYFIIPERLYTAFIDKADRNERGESAHIAARFNFAAGVLDEISRDISAARRIYERKEQEHDIAAAVRIKVCSKCRNGSYCLVSLSDNTAEGKQENRALAAAAEAVSRKGAVSEKDLSPGFDRCLKKTEILKALNRESLTEERRRYSQRLSSCICSASVEQLKAQRKVCENIAGGELRYNGRLSVIAGDALRFFDVALKSAAVFFDKSGRAYVECFMLFRRDLDLEGMTDRLSEITGTPLDVPVTEKMMGDRKILRCRWCSRPVFIADAGISTLPGGAEKSGDTAEFFTDGFGKYYMIVADGMGSGQRAAEESCMAVSVVRRFIRSGTGVEAAVRFCNILLAAVSGDEIFTTMDIMEFDCFTGRCVFYKQGAAESYVRRGEEIYTAENASLPLGIISETVMTPVTYYLGAGDCAVMITDGVTAGEDYIREAMMNDSVTAEMCAARILSAEEKAAKRKDDKTAAVIKIYKG